MFARLPNSQDRKGEMRMEYNLVFEGGGAKGLVFVGAIQEFEARGHTHRRLLGTSAGAITATLLAAGYNAAEMLPAIDEKLADGSPRFSSFLDVPEGFAKADLEESLSFSLLQLADLPFLPERLETLIDHRIMGQLTKLPAYRQVFSFVEKGGLYAGEKFRAWLVERLDAGGRELGRATMAEFQAKTGKDLTVVASDTTGETMLVLNHRTAPDCPVVAAVRMSMSVPFLWQEVVWQEAWGRYLGKDISGHAIVDGGVLSNFPIELLISRSPEVAELMGPHDGIFALGFLIDESLPVTGSPPKPGAKKKKKSGMAAAFDIQESPTLKRVIRLANTLTLARDKQVIDRYAQGVCRMPAQGYGTTEFDMTDHRREALIQAGREAARAFFDRLPSPSDI
jgi:predicted acylesterase/phospholipase RssA